MCIRDRSELARIAPAGTPRSFVVNTGAEAVENAIKSVLLNRVLTAGEKDGGFIISFEGAFHGRTLGSLAVTHRKKACLLYTSDAADERSSVDLGGRRIIKK